jgi:hypothetical protein
MAVEGRVQIAVRRGVVDHYRGLIGDSRGIQHGEHGVRDPRVMRKVVFAGQRSVNFSV